MPLLSIPPCYNLRHDPGSTLHRKTVRLDHGLGDSAGAVQDISKGDPVRNSDKWQSYTHESATKSAKKFLDDVGTTTEAM
jgi:hypothetical protein